MQTYLLELAYKPRKNFFTEKAANSMDLDIEKKLTHKMSIEFDKKQDFKIGLIVGNSGSGKTTLAKKIFGNKALDIQVDQNKELINLFDKKYTYEQRVSFLTAAGLNSLPCWLKPLKILSNGQRARAEIAFKMSLDDDVIVIDEFTSVVDRTIAKIISQNLYKFSQKYNKKIVLITCHNDIVEWLKPDWIIDCNDQIYIDRRSERQLKRKEKIKFEIRELESSQSWKSFSKYHYLSENLAGGKNYFYGLFCDGRQVGFQCFSNYVPFKNNQPKKIMHSNRTVIHPDYQGFGLGIRLVNACSSDMRKKGYKIMAKFSNIAMHKSRKKDKNWKFLKTSLNTSKSMRMTGQKMNRSTKKNDSAGFKTFIKTYHYEYKGGLDGK